MTYRNIFSFGLALIFSTGLIAQDQQAKDLLNKLSAKTKAYTSIEADFSYSLENKTEGVNETQDGKIIVQGEKYFVDVAGQKILSDGKNLYTVIEDAKEVQINYVPGEDEEDAINPTNIFTIYEKGFKYKMGETKGNIAEVILFPTNPGEKSFHTVKLWIDKTTTEVKKMMVMSKDGTNFTYNIKKMVTNKTYPESKFQYSKAAYPGYDVVDLR